ncbi:hypothetical protein RMCBS344292_13001 [Rhizopus microsporus]|nr:hypothetical protein RMCBS344292_13001 [Rhizopus microsporus]
MMTPLSGEVDSDSSTSSSEEEWVITSVDKKQVNKKRSPRLVLNTSSKTHSSTSSLSNLQKSSSSSACSSKNDSPIIHSAPLQYISNNEIKNICVQSDAKALISQLVCVYKSADIFLKIRDIETQSSMTFEMRLKEHMALCEDSCDFIINCLEELSVYFSENPKIKELTPKFRRLLTEVLCKGLYYFLETPIHERQTNIDNGPDLISFDDDEVVVPAQTTQGEMDLISFDEPEMPIPVDHADFKDDNDYDSSDDEEIPVINLSSPIDKYVILPKHQNKLVDKIDTIPSPVIVYYAIDAFKLQDVIACGCPREEDGVRLVRKLIKYGYFNEAITAIKKLDLFPRFDIPAIATDLFTSGQGMLLPTLVSQRPILQRELLDFIDKQLRFSFAGSLGIVAPERLSNVDEVQQLSRLKERKFQKDLVTCGTKVAQELKIGIEEYYFIHLSQRYACLRWILAQRAIQQMEDQDLSIEKSSNYNGLIDYVCENDPALTKLTIKELTDMGDTKSAAYFATCYKEEAFYCKYNALPLSERSVGIVKGEQLSRHWTSLPPKKPSNPNKLPYYELPPHAVTVMVNSEKTLMFMKDILSQSHRCGIDTEWVPAFAKQGSPGKTALMQIASDIKGYIFLVDLKTIFASDNKLLYRWIEKILQFLFEDEEILKIGKEKKS